MKGLALLLIPQLASALAIVPRDDCKRAAYFLDNNPAGASIVSLEIAYDGTLSNPVRTWTGGKGEFGLTGSPLAAPGADTLFTQDSVVVDHNYLFTVNAGSNTIAAFYIPPTDPYHPKLLNTAPTLGQFPVSVAYSAKHNIACVVNGGAVGGVACYSVSETHGLTPVGGLRPIALGQTTPPAGPPGTVSDIVFNPSQTALFVTVKGSPTTPGKIYVYPVGPSGVSTTPVVSNPSELLLDFSLTFLGSDSSALVTDPAYGASLIAISPTFAVTVTKKIVVAGEGAICWSEYSPRFDTVFIFDGGSANITLIDPASGAIKGAIVQSNFATAKGSLDSQLDRGYLYVLRGGSFVSVVDNHGLNGGKAPTEIQTLDLSSLGSRQGFQGLAIYS